jgi:hypothetical protein
MTKLLKHTLICLPFFSGLAAAADVAVHIADPHQAAIPEQRIDHRSRIKRAITKLSRCRLPATSESSLLIEDTVWLRWRTSS